MKVSKRNNMFSLVAENKDEENFLEFFIALMNGVPDKEFDDVVRKYKLNLVPCPATVQEQLKCNKCGNTIENQVFRCGLPANHKGKRHIPFLVWNE